jgi:chemotaxis protein histidine kinase CheA
MESEVETLEAARAAHAERAAQDTLFALYRSAHDLRGQAATFGFPLAGQIADGICTLIENSPAGAPAPQMLIDRHVEAIRAIVRENARERDNMLGLALVQRLSELRSRA